MPEAADPLISIPAAAKAIGLDRTTLGKQVRAGVVRSHDGKVRLSEVLEDRAANIDLGRSKRRQGAIDEPERTDTVAPSPAPLAEPVRAAAEPEGDEPAEPATVIVDGQPMSYADARALKETYLARLKGLELDTKRGELAPVAGMVAFAERMFGTVRERLLAIPGKLSGDLDDVQAERLVSELHEALEELSDPRTYAEHAGESDGEEADGGLDGPEAAAAAQPRGMGRALPLRGAEDQRRPR